MAEHKRAGRDFGWALARLKDGEIVYREEWLGSGMWLKLQVPDKHSKMQQPYIYVSISLAHPAGAGGLVPWVASQSDLLAEDWMAG